MRNAPPEELISQRRMRCERLRSTAERVVFQREALPALPELEGEWRTLEKIAFPSFFASWHWIGTLLAALPEASRPALLRGSADGATVALALVGAQQKRRRFGLVRARGLYLNETGDPGYDTLTIEHNGILATPDSAAAAWEALIEWFASSSNEADELHISGSLWRLPAPMLQRHGLTCSETPMPSYSLDLMRLSTGGEPYPVLSANARQQLRRARRHFERFGSLQVREARNLTEALAFFAAMKRLHCASWQRRGRPHSFTFEFFEPFHRLLIERSFAEGGTQLLQAWAGDRVIGYLYNFRLGDRVYAYQSGFDDADRRERPGVVTHALAIQHAFQSGAKVYDFMAGRNRLKESFATQCDAMLWQTVQQPRLVFRFERLARRLKQRLTSGAKSARQKSGRTSRQQASTAVPAGM